MPLAIPWRATGWAGGHLQRVPYRLLGRDRNSLLANGESELLKFASTVL